MQYEVIFNGGPKDGEKKIYPSQVMGPLYAYRIGSEHSWHYYALTTRGTAQVPASYEYLGASEEQLDDIATAKEHFSKSQE